MSHICGACQTGFPLRVCAVTASSFQGKREMVIWYVVNVS